MLLRIIAGWRLVFDDFNCVCGLSLVVLFCGLLFFVVCTGSLLGFYLGCWVCFVYCCFYWLVCYC